LGVRVGSVVKQGTAPAPDTTYSARTNNPQPQVNDHGQTQMLFPLD
jgi:DNA polymerase-4